MKPTKQYYDPKKILNEVCLYYDLSPEIIRGRSRKAHIIQARHMYIYLCYKYSRWSGAAYCQFINRDHSTGIYVRDKYNGYMTKGEKAQYKDLVSRLDETDSHPFLRAMNSLGIAFAGVDFTMLTGVRDLGLLKKSA